MLYEAIGAMSLLAVADHWTRKLVAVSEAGGAETLLLESSHPRPRSSLPEALSARAGGCQQFIFGNAVEAVGMPVLPGEGCGRLRRISQKRSDGGVVVRNIDAVGGGVPNRWRYPRPDQRTVKLVEGTRKPALRGDAAGRRDSVHGRRRLGRGGCHLGVTGVIGGDAVEAVAVSVHTGEGGRGRACCSVRR